MKKLAVIVLLLLSGIPAAGQAAPAFGPVINLSQCWQNCFNQWLANLEQCQATHCTDYLLFEICNQEGYNECSEEAGNIYQQCKQDCMQPRTGEIFPGLS